VEEVLPWRPMHHCLVCEVVAFVISDRKEVVRCIQRHRCLEDLADAFRSFQEVHRSIRLRTEEAAS